MGKLLCDSAAASVDTLPPPSPPLLTWQPLPPPPPPPGEAVAVASPACGDLGWAAVRGLEDQQRRALSRISERGVAWKVPAVVEAPPGVAPATVVFGISHGGEVDSDGNCLFTAARRAMATKATARELRMRCVRRFRDDVIDGGSGGVGGAAEGVDDIVRHLYSPDLRFGWGIHVVQEVKLLALKAEREAMDAAIAELVDLGLRRETAAETIYKERCLAVSDAQSWAKYMSISGSSEDEYDIITLQYTEEGLLTIDENRSGHAAAFGDDIAIECMATEFKREVYVVQAHGSDAMVDEDNCVFFLPHRPRGEISETPIFLFMKGTGWCGAGADHYEPLIATPLPHISPDKAAIAL